MDDANQVILYTKGKNCQLCATLYEVHKLGSRLDRKKAQPQARRTDQPVPGIAYILIGGPQRRQGHKPVEEFAAACWISLPQNGELADGILCIVTKMAPEQQQELRMMQMHPGGPALQIFFDIDYTAVTHLLLLFTKRISLHPSVSGAARDDNRVRTLRNLTTGPKEPLLHQLNRWCQRKKCGSGGYAAQRQAGSVENAFTPRTAHHFLGLTPKLYTPPQRDAWNTKKQPRIFANDEAQRRVPTWRLYASTRSSASKLRRQALSKRTRGGRSRRSRAQYPFSVNAVLTTFPQGVYSVEPNGVQLPPTISPTPHQLRYQRPSKSKTTRHQDPLARTFFKSDLRKVFAKYAHLLRSSAWRLLTGVRGFRLWMNNIGQIRMLFLIVQCPKRFPSV